MVTPIFSRNSYLSFSVRARNSADRTERGALRLIIVSPVSRGHAIVQLRRIAKNSRLQLGSPRCVWSGDVRWLDCRGEMDR